MPHSLLNIANIAKCDLKKSVLPQDLQGYIYRAVDLIDLF